jgi:hypothetical protein
MVHRIDAKDGVERIIIERQSGIGVRDFERYPISLIGVRHTQVRGSDSRFVGVDPRHSAIHFIGDIPRGSAGPTGDFENVMLRPKIKPRNKPIVFLDCGPTVLANVPTGSLLTNRLKDLFGEMAVRAVEKINAFRHSEDLSVDRM